MFTLSVSDYAERISNAFKELEQQDYSVSLVKGTDGKTLNMDFMYKSEHVGYAEFGIAGNDKTLVLYSQRDSKETFNFARFTFFNDNDQVAEHLVYSSIASIMASGPTCDKYSAHAIVDDCLDSAGTHVSGEEKDTWQVCATQPGNKHSHTKKRPRQEGRTTALGIVALTQRFKRLRSLDRRRGVLRLFHRIGQGWAPFVARCTLLAQVYAHCTRLNSVQYQNTSYIVKGDSRVIALSHSFLLQIARRRPAFSLSP